MPVHVEVLVRIAQREVVFVGQRAVGALVQDVQADAVVGGAQAVAVAVVDQRLHGHRPHMRADQVAGIAVETEETALVQDPLQVFGVRRVVGVVDLDAFEVDAFFLEDGDLPARDLAVG